jgi:hypothetical protein
MPERARQAAALREQCDEAAHRLLAAQQRDVFSPTYGSFDRRYWAWKMAELPEATLQRNVHPLALLYRDAPRKRWTRS